MTETINSAIGTLREALRDGEKGFATAADDAQRQDLKELFHNYSLQRATFGLELDGQLRQISQLGGDPEESGTVTGALHRGWIALRSAVSSGGDLAVLEECLRGEESALATYQAASDDPSLTGELHALVVSQRLDIQAAFDRISSLKAASHAA